MPCATRCSSSAWRAPVRRTTKISREFRAHARTVVRANHAFTPGCLRKCLKIKDIFGGAAMACVLLLMSRHARTGEDEIWRTWNAVAEDHLPQWPPWLCAIAHRKLRARGRDGARLHRRRF